MGNSKSSSSSSSKRTPKNVVSKSVVQAKLRNAHKLGVLSLTEHKLTVVPLQIFEISMLKTLDLSFNEIREFPSSDYCSSLPNLKTLNLSNNRLYKGSLPNLTCLQNLQNLNLSDNNIGQESGQKPKTKKITKTATPASAHTLLSLPPLPTSLKTLNLAKNSLNSIPPQALALPNLTSLTLSNNSIASIPTSMSSLSSLKNLYLDENSLTSLPPSLFAEGRCCWPDLKTLDLSNNGFATAGFSTLSATSVDQPLPKGLFTDTKLHDLRLAGNPMEKRVLMEEFEGFDAFLKRREGVKRKDLDGGAMADLSLCGLD
mmetsp:Transcript_12618/g.25803  ORF Transcript_12618/g.25803 Transcript_12618/m.25803 type:complete len:315 (-) Transcript_12618:86-1030(-)